MNLEILKILCRRTDKTTTIRQPQQYMITPLVSVVMSVLDGADFLSEAVESILAQTFRDFEFIIVNDGSTDASASILDYFQQQDGRVQVYHRENRGLVESLNWGCSLARGKYIARMDADDIAVCERLAWQVRFMERDPNIGALGGAVELIDGPGASLGVAYTPLNDHEIRSRFPECPFWHPTVIMRTQAFRSTGGYRKIVIDAEDHDLWLRMAERFALANLGDVIVRYRVHPGQVSVRKCKQQSLSGLAAAVAARARWNGEPDPLDHVTEITPQFLTDHGTSKLEQDIAFARRYLWRVMKYSKMYDQTFIPNVLNEIDELISSVKHARAARWVISDLQLVQAKLYWRQSKRVKALGKITRAICRRPVIVARPVKPLVRQLRVKR
jgi:glycosyltransferase involved in cell wall biosynthesis